MSLSLRELIELSSEFLDASLQSSPLASNGSGAPLDDDDVVLAEILPSLLAEDDSFVVPELAAKLLLRYEVVSESPSTSTSGVVVSILGGSGVSNLARLATHASSFLNSSW